MNCRECTATIPAGRKFCSRPCASKYRSKEALAPAAFWRRVDKTHPSGCWIWLGSLTAAGYGNLRVPGARNDYAHRVAYRLVVGEIPDGLHLDHLCRNTRCCNPAHLEAVTPAENARRGLGPYGPLRKTCVHGHDITDPSNVYTAPKGDNRCRVCSEIRSRARRSNNWPPKTCPQGHEFTPDNTYRSKAGHRRCAECERQRARRNHLASKGIAA